MHTTFTSGAARRNAIDAQRPAAPGFDSTPEEYAAYGAELDAVIARVNTEHHGIGHVNPILDYFRDDTYHGDPDMHDVATDYLYQLSRHWADWQSPRVGTFPHYARSYAGPATREESEETGEDRAYWYIWDALIGQTDGDRVQDMIVHATAVIGRLYTMSGECEHDWDGDVCRLCGDDTNGGNK